VSIHEPDGEHGTVGKNQESGVWIDVQVRELANYLGAGNRPTMIVTPIESSDPYTCITLNRLKTLYQEQQPEVPEVAFSPDDESTVREMAKRVCREQGVVTAFYIARSRDLGKFFAYLAERYDTGFCTATITVVSTSDAPRTRHGCAYPSRTRIWNLRVARRCSPRPSLMADCA